MTRLAVLGGGSWGTTFAQVLADSGAQVTLWARREEVAREIREEHRNRTYLGGHRLPAEVTATSSVAEAVDGADGIVVRSEEHTSELQSRGHLVCRLLLEKKKELSVAE